MTWTKAGAVTIGLTVMVVGVIPVFLSYTYFNDCQTTAVQIAQQVNNTIASECELAAVGVIAGGFIAVIGFVIAIVGGITAPTTLPPPGGYYMVQPPVPPPPRPPPVQAGWLCANCRQLNASPTGAPIQYCQHCGMQHVFPPAPG